MPINKISFVGADIEVGQSQLGLSEASELFIDDLPPKKTDTYFKLR